MPSDNLVLQVRQIAGYPPATYAGPAATLLMQIAGLGSAYQAISPAALVGTALAQGGDMTMTGAFAAGSIGSVNGTFANLKSTVVDAQKVCAALLCATDGTIGGIPIATQADVAASVLAFNGRSGAVTLWLEDVLAAGGAPIFNPRFVGCPRADTPDPCDYSTRLATTEFVQRNTVLYFDSFLTDHPLVWTFNGRSGVVTLTEADIEAALAGSAIAYAPLNSPNFTGYPSAPTAPSGSSDGQIATTAFVMNAVAESVTGVASFNGRTGLVVLQGSDLTTAGGALIASPAFTGTPSAPTPTAGDNSTRIATTAFVMGAGAGSWASINSPAFTGTPTAPTAPLGTDTTQLATTAFVMNEVTAANAGVISFNGRSGVVSLLANDISAAGGATLGSPAFTGLPTAPTASVGAATSQLANCAFVTSAIGALPPVPLASTAAPLMNGTATAGSSAAYSRGDHVHPTDTTRAAASALANYLPLIGGALTGLLSGTQADFSTNVSAQSINASGSVGASNLSTSTLTATGAVTLQAAVTLTAGGLQINRGAAVNTTVILNDGSTNRSAFFFETSTGHTVLQDQFSGGEAYIATDATFTITGPNAFKAGGGVWATLSDARVKTVEGDYAQGLDDVLKLKPVIYRYKGNDTDYPEARSPHALAAKARTLFVGLIAQEVEPIFPGMVTKREGWIDGKKVGDVCDLDTSSLIYALVNAVKTLANRVAMLEQPAT